MATGSSSVLAQAGGDKTSLLNDIKTIVDLIGTSITALAIIVGAVWAYFKFIRGRTFKPRLEVTLGGQWHHVEGHQLLQSRVSLKNIGASKVSLLQKGTGLRINSLASNQPTAPNKIIWTSLGVFEIFSEHQWVEPGETISDDLLLNLGASRPLTTLFEARLVCQRSVLRNIAVFKRRVVPGNSIIDTLTTAE